MAGGGAAGAIGIWAWQSCGTMTKAEERNGGIGALP
jgi:hypothetical protein